MEYLTLMGNDLKTSLSQSLGENAAFFWSVIAPVGLAIIWVGSLYALWESWFRNGEAKERGGGLLFKALFTFIMVGVVLAAGSAFEYLVLGEGMVHARLLGGVLDLVGPH
jgi:hypothetical protein